MKNKKRFRVFAITALICMTMIGAAALTKAEEVLDGENISYRDTDALQEITSQDIVSFDLSCYLANRWNVEDDGFFHFAVQPEEEGKLIASEEYLGIQLPADEELLSALQEIIETEDLVSLNGIYDVTAGLPPEYAAGGLNVSYASGETLSFTMDNNPYALWGEKMYDVFAHWFVAQGEDSLLPERETSQVERVRFMTVEDDIYTEFSDQMEDTLSGIKKHFLHMDVFDNAAQKTILEKRVLLPEDYFATITEILDRYDVALKYDFSRYDRENGNYGNHDRGYFGMAADHPENEEDGDSRVLLHAYYESGKKLNIDTKKPSEIDGMKDLLEELLGYYQALFEE